MWYLIDFLTYFLHLLAGAFFIVGFFAITRGTEIIQPDGSIKRVGKIFKGWFFFWFKEYPGKIKIYYKEEELLKITAQIRTIKPGTDIKVYSENNSEKNPVILHCIQKGLFDEYFWIEIESRLGVKIKIIKSFIPDKSQGSEFAYVIFKLYKEDPDYIFPWYVRDALAGCITCHSSWLGSICFWALDLAGAYSNAGIRELIFMWVTYCISEAFIVTALWKKYM